MTLWKIVDARIDEPVTMCAFLTREQAEQQIEAWRERDAKGKRQDVSHLLPHLAVRERRATD